MRNAGLAAIYLQEALQQRGCPICRCSAWHGDRYIQMLLWEHVNDAESRLSLIQSLGFCQQHSVQMLEMERREHGMVLGNSILYESLIRATLTKLRQTEELLSSQSSLRARFRRLLRRSRKRRAGEALPRDRYLRPTRSCRVCEINREAGDRYSAVLLRMLAGDELRTLYARSDGVCLPHLRAMLRQGTATAGLEHVLATATAQAEQLVADLDGLRRKHTVSIRNAPLTEEEAHSIERAIAFLTGSQAIEPHQDD